MPLIQTLLTNAISAGNIIRAQRLLETLFVAGIFYPEFVLEFIDHYVDKNNGQFSQPLASGLSFMLPMYPEAVSAYIERWQFTVEQRQFIYEQVDYNLPYRAYHSEFGRKMG